MRTGILILMVCVSILACDHHKKPNKADHFQKLIEKIRLLDVGYSYNILTNDADDCYVPDQNADSLFYKHAFPILGMLRDTSEWYALIHLEPGDDLYPVLKTFNNHGDSLDQRIISYGTCAGLDVECEFEECNEYFRIINKNQIEDILTLTTAQCDKGKIIPGTSKTEIKRYLITIDTQGKISVEETMLNPTNEIAASDSIDGYSEDDECVFNNDIEHVTSKWLKGLGKNNFSWRGDIQQAQILSGQDTIFVSQGGCAHFNTTVEIKSNDDGHLITDSIYWTDKALKLATEFKLDDYAKMIKAGKFKINKTDIKRLWYEFEDYNPDDNIYYEGIEIKYEDKARLLTMTEYMN